MNQSEEGTVQSSENSKFSVGELAAALLWILMCAAAAGIAIGAVWGFVDWVRYVGTGFTQPPFIASVGSHVYAGHPILGPVETFIDWYNSTVISAVRFGSGVGLITGIVYAFGKLKSRSVPTRIITGLLAGALIFGRIALMITSDPRYFVAFAAFGAVFCAVYLWREGSARRLPPLPVIEFGQV